MANENKGNGEINNREKGLYPTHAFRELEEAIHHGGADCHGDNTELHEKHARTCRDGSRTTTGKILVWVITGVFFHDNRAGLDNRGLFWVYRHTASPF